MPLNFGRNQPDVRAQSLPARSIAQHTKKANEPDAGVRGGNTTHGNTKRFLPWNLPRQALADTSTERSRTIHIAKASCTQVWDYAECRSFPRRGWDRSSTSGWSFRACVVVDRGSWCSSRVRVCWPLSRLDTMFWCMIFLSRAAQSCTLLSSMAFGAISDTLLWLMIHRSWPTELARK